MSFCFDLGKKKEKFLILDTKEGFVGIVNIDLNSTYK